MKYIKYLITVLIIFNFNFSFAQDKNLELKITKFALYNCQGQSIYDSDSDFANSVKILVQKKIDEGLSEKQIYSFLKDRYGQWILLVLNLIKILIFYGYYLY